MGSGGQGGQKDKETRRQGGQGEPARCGGLLRCSDWRGQGGQGDKKTRRIILLSPHLPISPSPHPPISPSPHPPLSPSPPPPIPPSSTPQVGRSLQSHGWL
ncbi:hypothetical protein PI95_021430 [Hassallia byssoidea VB512170]|uniref:Uncharacterized protein n=1 Tax=Hassallia byssoidea VB512170 TaxID=1304833 RepID=A0A846HBR9_9CYAN|nr:hypothetical protein [Hassalia byssoidea]NEU75047.1 hypothetical protein [Hassalia byssoidea VB512170]